MENSNNFIKIAKEILSNSGTSVLGDLIISESKLQTSRKIVKSLKTKANARRTIFEKIADFTTSVAGSFIF
jgi:hypothetical protein